MLRRLHDQFCLSNFERFLSAFCEVNEFLCEVNEFRFTCSFLWDVEGIYESPAQNSQIQKSFVHPCLFCTVRWKKTENENNFRTDWVWWSGFISDHKITGFTLEKSRWRTKTENTFSFLMIQKQSCARRNGPENMHFRNGNYRAGRDMFFFCVGIVLCAAAHAEIWTLQGRVVSRHGHTGVQRIEPRAHTEEECSCLAQQPEKLAGKNGRNRISLGMTSAAELQVRP